MESGSFIFNNDNSSNSSDGGRRRGGKKHRKRGGRGQRTRTQKLDLFSLCSSPDTSTRRHGDNDSSNRRSRSRSRGGGGSEGRDGGIIIQRNCHSAPTATTTPSPSRKCNVITTTRADSIVVRHPTDDTAHHEIATALEHGAHHDTICSICCMGIPLTGMATAHGCNHLFCYTCISKWVGSYRSTCPVCTSQITLLHRWLATPTETKDTNEDSLGADTESNSSLDECSDREEMRTPAVAAEVVIDITLKNGDVTSLRLTIQTERIEKREMSNHSRDLSCLDHAFFSQEIDQVLSEAIRVHRGMRSAYCSMQSNYKFNTRFKRESQKAWDHVQEIKNNLAAMKEEMIRQTPFDPEFCMQQLYHMQQKLSEIEAASNPYMAVYVGGWGPLDHNLSYTEEMGDYHDDDDDDDDDDDEW